MNQISVTDQIVVPKQKSRCTSDVMAVLTLYCDTLCFSLPDVTNYIYKQHKSLAAGFSASCLSRCSCFINVRGRVLPRPHNTGLFLYFSTLLFTGPPLSARLRETVAKFYGYSEQIN